MDEHKTELNKLYQKLNSTKNGLTTEEAEKRIITHGLNTIEIKKKFPLIFKFFKQITNFFAFLLIIGSILSFTAEFLSPGLGNLYIGIALQIVVFINATFTFIQEYQSEKIIELFQKMLPSTVEIYRNNHHMILFTFKLGL